MSRVYLVFRGTHETLKAESVLQAAGLLCKVVMKPSAIQLDCGLAVRADQNDQPLALSTLEAKGIRPRGVFTV